MERKQQPAVLKFAVEEDMNDDKLAVKTLRNHSAVKLRNRSLSTGQKVVRLKRGTTTTQRRRLLSHGRAVELIRRKRAASLPSPTQPATGGSVLPPPQTPDKSSPVSAGGMQKDRAGVFERNWVDLTADDMTTVSPSTPVERSQIAEGGDVVTDLLPSPTEDEVTTSVTSSAVDIASDVEDVSSRVELSLPVEDVSCFYLFSLLYFLPSVL